MSTSNAAQPHTALCVRSLGFALGVLLTVPTPTLAASAVEADHPVLVVFNGDGVFDAWDAVVATSFDQPGAKVVQVEVTDNQGAVARAEVTVQVE